MENMILSILKGHNAALKSNHYDTDLGVIITGDFNAYIPMDNTR